MKDRFYLEEYGGVNIRILIKWLKSTIHKYELKHPQYEKLVHICNSVDTRNRYKYEKYKIPEDHLSIPSMRTIVVVVVVSWRLNVSIV